MSNVEAFCAQQGNALRKPLKFEGQMVRNLDPDESVCRQLHEMWMRSGGRQMMYAEFKKRLRFKSTDDLVSVWLSWGSTPVLVAGLSGLGAVGITTAVVHSYKAWQKSKANSYVPNVPVCNKPETWDEVPPGLKAPVFEYVSDLKNVPAHLLSTLYLAAPITLDDGFNYPDDIDKHAIQGLMLSGGLVSNDHLQKFIAGTKDSGLDDTYKQWDVRTHLPSLIPNIVKPQTTLKYDMSTKQKILWCGDVDFSSQFDEIEPKCNVFGFWSDSPLTYDNDNGEVRRRQYNDECLLHVPADSRSPTEGELKSFRDIVVFDYTESKYATVELTNRDLSQNINRVMVDKQIANKRMSRSPSMYSYLVLSEAKFEPKDDDQFLVFFVKNPQDLDTITFNCTSITLGQFTFELKYMAFKDEAFSNVVVKVKDAWVFYGDQDPQNSKEHMRKLVPQNNLNCICAVPYILIYAKNLE